LYFEVLLEKKTGAERCGGDCPMAGQPTQEGPADGSQAGHPLGLLRKVYGTWAKKASLAR